MKLYDIIFEQQINNLKQELTVTVQKLRKLNTHEELKNFCESNFKKIGMGFSRITYDAGGFVVKLSKSPDSTIQNKNEIEIKKNCKGSDKYFTQIYAYDTANFFWLVCEKVEPLRVENEIIPHLVRSLKGTDEELIHAIAFNRDKIETFLGILIGVMRGDVEEPVNVWLQNFADILNRCDISPDDFGEENWGLRSNGELVVLDYGL